MGNLYSQLGEINYNEEFIYNIDTGKMYFHCLWLCLCIFAYIPILQYDSVLTFTLFARLC